MGLYAARILRKRIDPEEQSGYWIDRYRRLLERCVRDRDVLPEAQTIDVYFHEWIKNPDTILREIYKRADLPLTDQTLGELHAYLAAHETAKQGKRSEEHTSELQSLMSISYAVFCLKKKKKNNKHTQLITLTIFKQTKKHINHHNK